MKSNIYYLFAFIMLFYSGCKDDDLGPTGPDDRTDEKPYYEDGSGIIGKKGGTVALMDTTSSLNGTFVEIPEGVLDSDTHISISEGTSEVPDDNAIVVRFEPEGLIFSNPVRIGLPFNEEYDPESIRAYYYKSGEGEEDSMIEELVIDSVDVQNRIVLAGIDHFSEFYSGDNGVYMDIEMVNIDGKIAALVWIYRKYEEQKSVGLIPTRRWFQFTNPGQTLVKNLIERRSGYYATSFFAVDLYEWRPTIFLRDIQHSRERLVVNKYEDHYWGTVRVSRSDGTDNTEVYHRGNRVLNEDEYDLWWGGKALVFRFDDVQVDPAKQYYIRARWYLRSGVEMTSSKATSDYSFNNSAEKSSINELRLFDGDIDKNYVKDIYQHTVGSRPTVPANPSPSDNASAVSTNTNLSWESTDPDGKPLEFDIYFGTSTNPELVISGHTSKSYDPGTLNQSTTYYWKIVAHDEFGNSTEGPVWKFTTEGGPTVPTSSITDIDGNEYLTVKIGDQWWMAENLRTSRYRNGDEIPNITDDSDWNNLTTGAWSHANNDKDNEEIYGKLYNWYTVGDSRGLCPVGWSVPTNDDWVTLANYLGGSNVAGGKLKSTRTEPEPHPRWKSPNTGATNESGFSGFPGGYRSTNGDFRQPGIFGYWWNSTENNVILGWNNAGINFSDHSGWGFGYLQSGFSVRCIKREQDNPTVTTSNITNITETTATGGGEVTDDGGSAVIARGVVWSTSSNPTLETKDGYTTDGSGTGSFTSDITNLTPGTTYYVRAYATNDAGTAYGNEVSFKTTFSETQLPSVTTENITNISVYSATGGGNVTNDGGATVTARGVVWSTSQQPTLTSNDGYTTDGSGTGSFTSNLTGLEPNTRYYVRAYATNNVGTAYGSEINFTTANTDHETGIVSDIDGNTYKTIKIGDQWWMAENLRVSRYRNGSSIPSGLSNNAWQNTTNGAYAIYPHNEIDGLNSDANVVSAYGKLYNWYAVDDEGGLCPVDWQVPTNEDWNTLIVYLGGHDVAGGKLKSTRTDPISHPRWNSPNIGANNESGWSGLPGGGKYDSGGYVSIGYEGYWWATTEGGVNSSWAVRADHYLTLIYDGWFHKNAGFSVRCIKREQDTPTVTTSSITNITETTATGGGEVTSDGGSTVTARGVVWSTSQNPTLTSNDGYTTDGSGTGSFTSNLTGLNPDTQYYVRAYATNSQGTAYGNQVSFRAGDDDHDTEVVDVLNPATGKTWMDRNLGASRAAESSTDDQAYGHLYQWGRAADGHQVRTSGTTSTLSSSDTPGHGDFITVNSSPWDWRSPQNDNLWQGINGINNPCPAGYRLPTEAEWDAERQSWGSNNAAGAFASPLKLPVAGHRYFSNGSLFIVGSYGDYWSSTVDGARSRRLLFYSTSARMGSYYRASGLSVRCLKDDTSD